MDKITETLKQARIWAENNSKARIIKVKTCDVTKMIRLAQALRDQRGLEILLENHYFGDDNCFLMRRETWEIGLAPEFLALARQYLIEEAEARNFVLESIDEGITVICSLIIITMSWTLFGLEN